MDAVLVWLLLGAVLVFGPIVALFAFGSLALFIWSWRRLGPFLAGVGRWGADWRNFVPFFGLIFVFSTIFGVLAVYGSPAVALVMIGLLLIIVPLFLFVSLLTLVVWIVRFFRLLRLAIS